MFSGKVRWNAGFDHVEIQHEHTVLSVFILQKIELLSALEHTVDVCYLNLLVFVSAVCRFCDVMTLLADCL